MSDDDIIRDAERRIAAMTAEERNELLHRSDGYYAFVRDYGQGPLVRTFYKVVGIDQWRLVEGRWEPLGDRDTYKNEPSWWLISGEVDFNKIDASNLPPGTPE